MTRFTSGLRAGFQRLGTEKLQVASARRRSRLFAILSVLLVIGLFLGAGAAFTVALQSHSVPSAESLSRAALPVPPGDGLSTVSNAQTDNTGSDSVAGSAASSGSSSSSAQTSAQTWDRMIIRNGTISLSVKDVLATADQIRSLATAHGGYVTQSDSHQEGDSTVASITIQVPAQEFDNVFPLLRKLGVKTLQESVTSSDVTDQYTDLQSQLRNLQATQQRLLDLESKATDLQDIMSIDQQLQQVEGSIEQIEGRTTYISKASQMATITISLTPDAALAPTTPEPAPGWNPGVVAAQAWNASGEMLSGVADAVISVTVFMWWALPLLLLVLWVILRPRRVQGQTPTGTEA